MASPQGSVLPEALRSCCNAESQKGKVMRSTPTGIGEGVLQHFRGKRSMFGVRTKQMEEKNCEQSDPDISLLHDGQKAQIKNKS